MWRNRDVALLVSGSTVNEIGDWLLELALPLYVFIETGSGVQTAAIYLARLMVGFLCGPIGGRLVDGWRLKPTLVGTNLLQAVALTPLLAVTPDRIWPIFIVVVLQGAIGSVNNPASFALMPRLVAGDQLIAANSALSGGGSIGRLVGATVGGIVVEFGGMGTVVLLDGATFVFGAVTAALLSSRADERPARDAPDGEDADVSVRQGLREVRAIPSLMALLWVRSLAFFVFGGFPILFIVFVTDALDRNAADVGFLRASTAVTAIVAATVIARAGDRIAPPDLLVAGYVTFGAVAYGFVNAPSLTDMVWVSFAFYIATGFPNMATGVATDTTAQLLSPPDVLGRIGGLMGSIGALTMGLGSIAAGLLVEHVSARALLNVQATIFMGCAAVAFVYLRRPWRADQAEVR